MAKVDWHCASVHFAKELFVMEFFNEVLMTEVKSGHRENIVRCYPPHNNKKILLLEIF